MLELEKTYLAKYLPEDLKKSPSKELIDVYIPGSHLHPRLRLRKNGGNFEITKKQPKVEGDASAQTEETIVLSREEFEALNNQVEGKRVRKIRYFYNHQGRRAEIDVFQDDLEGLVLVDFEFESVNDKEKFLMPGFCLAEVTQEDFIAGGMLCGKGYEDIEKKLNKYNYSKIVKNKL
ncbi:MAG: CYTH domain-containing protein [Patescibacteria group bacterium]